MANPKAAWGMEIGAAAIKAIRLEREGDSVRVTDFAVVPHKKVLSTPDVDQAAKNLVTLGAKAIVFAPIGFVTENHETQLDIGYTIDKLGATIETSHLSTLNDDPHLLRLGAEWVMPLIEELRG